MGDGIKYVFEVDGETPGLDALLSKLESAEKILPKVDQHTRAAGEGHKKHGKEAEHLGSVIERVTHQALHPFLERAKQIAEFEFIRKGVDALIEAPFEIAEKLKELGEEMVDVAAKAERTNTSFELLFGSEEGSEVLEYIEDIAKATEFSGDKMKGFAMELAKVGFKGEELKRALGGAIDIAALSPNKEEGMSAALTALERVKASGRVDTRTLLRFGLGPEEFFKELSARTGKSVAQLKKDVEAGKVKANDSIESLYTLIAKKTGKELGGAGLKVGEGLEAKLTHLKELPERFFEKFAKTDAIAKLTVQVDKLLEKLDPDGPEGRRIFGTLKSVFDTIVDSLEHFDIAGLVTGVVDAVETATIMLLELLALLPGETGKNASFVLNNTKRRREERRIDEADRKDLAGKGTTPEFEEEADYAALDDAAKSGEERRIDEADRKDLAGKGTTPEFEEEADYAALDDAAKSGALGAKSKAYADGKAAGQATADGMAEGLSEGLPKVQQAGAALGEAASGGTRKALDIHSPSKVFADLGEQTAAGFAIGVQKGARMVDDVTAGAFAVPAPQGGRVAASGAPMVFSVGDVIVHVHGTASSSASELGAEFKVAARELLIEIAEDFRTEAGV